MRPRRSAVDLDSPGPTRLTRPPASHEKPLTMPSLRSSRWFSWLFGDYGMLGVLLLLCLYYCWATVRVHHATGPEAARQLAHQVVAAESRGARVVVLAGTGQSEEQFAARLESRLDEAGLRVDRVRGAGPPEAGAALERLAAAGTRIDAVAATSGFRRMLDRKREDLAALRDARVYIPERYLWPTFLTSDNLLNVASQIVVIAVIAVGMTMVIITGGIDLSVGSLVALSAVVAAKLITVQGGTEASGLACVLSGLAAVTVCAAVGALSGVMIAWFKMPPFIATLGMMQVASGLAFKIAGGQSIYQIPESFTWLGRGRALGWLPYAVLLMLVSYAVAHAVMSRTRLGRHIYAVGGNRQAARLSGIRVNRVLLAVYIACGAMAGVGGVVLASELKSGAPTYGIMYELYVIAAVVVGGTSLSGGEGKVFGTLIGALIIAVIGNGMNLTDVSPYDQKIVLGAVILGAVLLDMVKKQGWRLLRAAE
jgi:ribose transport system permease protein